MVTDKLKFQREPPRIAYISELHKDYMVGIRAAKTIEELREVLGRYKPFAYDAWKQGQSITWKEWRRGLRLSKVESMEAAEEANKLAGDILFPELIFKVSLLAVQYPVPFGVAFNRLADFGRIKWKKDHFVILDPPKAKDE